MSEQPCQDALVDWDAFLEERRKFKLESSAYDLWTRTRPDPSITEELHSIYVKIFGHHFAPDAATYAAPFDRLVALIDDGLRFKEQRKQIADILCTADMIHNDVMAYVVSESQLRDPGGNYPPEWYIPQLLDSLIDRCLKAPTNDAGFIDKLGWLKWSIEIRGGLYTGTYAPNMSNWKPKSRPQSKPLDEIEQVEVIDTADEEPDDVTQRSSSPPAPHDVCPYPLSQKRLPSSFVPPLLTAMDIIPEEWSPISHEFPFPLPQSAYSALLPAKSTRRLTASQSFDVSSTSDSRPNEGIHAPFSRSVSLPLLPQTQPCVLTALETLGEEEEFE